MKKNKPLVSIVMITYNHEKYIEQAINGVLMQIGNFNIELIISNDNSTDKTEEVVLNLKKHHKQGSLIRYFKQEPNIGMSPNFLFSLKQCKGSFIALCEGDDFWLDQNKIEKQLNICKKKEAVNLVCHAWHKIREGDDNEPSPVYSSLVSHKEGFQFGLKEFSLSWFTKTLTVLFKREAIDFDEMAKYKYFRDKHLIYHILTSGDGYFINEPMAVYRIHDGGVFSMIGLRQQKQIAYNVHRELFVLNRSNRYTKQLYFESMRNILAVSISQLNTESSFKIFKELLSQIRKPSEIRYPISVFILAFVRFYRNAFKVS